MTDLPGSNQDVIRARDLRPRDVIEHPWDGELILVEGVKRGAFGDARVVTFVPYADIGGRAEDLTVEGNFPVQSFPPVATAHADLGGDLAKLRGAPPLVPNRLSRPR